MKITFIGAAHQVTGSRTLVEWHPGRFFLVDNGLEQGENCYQMVGIYYWSKEDAKKLQKDLKKTFEQVPGGRDLYWETIPNQLYQGKYKISIIPCTDSDVVEIDTFDELKQIDKTYI